jgi:restriction endonuclease S subunit
LAFSLLEPGSFLAAPASFITSDNNLFLLGILCSSYAKYFIYNNSDTTGAGDIMLNIQSLEKLPIPMLSVESRTVFCDIVDQIIDLKQNSGVTIKQERELDRTIYDVFDFNEREISVLENL